MRNEFLLFKENVKTLFHDKFQFILILLLVIVTCALASGLWITNAKLSDEANLLEIKTAKYDYAGNYLNDNVDVNQLSYFSKNFGEINTSGNTYKSEKDSGPAWFASTSNPQISTIDARVLINADSINNEYGLIVNQNGVSFSNWVNWIPGDYQLNPYFNPAKNLYFFNMDNKNVSSSVYGQLILEYEKSHNSNYLNTAWNLLCYIAPIIQESQTSLSSIFIPSFTTWKNKIESQDQLVNYKSFFTNWFDKNTSSTPALFVKDNTQSQKILSITHPNANLFGAPMFYSSNNIKLFSSQFSGNNNEVDIPSLFTFSFKTTDGSSTKMLFNAKDESHYEFLIQAASLASGFKSIFRRSYTYNDNATKTLFSMVNIAPPGLSNSFLENFKIFLGHMPQSTGQVIVNPQFAKIHNYKIGDIFQVNGRRLTISGIGGDAYYMYPVIDESSVIPDVQHEAIIYQLNSLYQSSDMVPYDLSARTLSDAVFFKTISNHSSNESFVSLQNNLILKNQSDTNPLQYAQTITRKNNGEVCFTISSFNNLPKAEQVRTIWFNSLVKIFNLVTILITIVLCVITLVSSFAITKSLVRKASTTLGILKASGYKSLKLSLGYLIIPLIICTVAVPIGWLIGIGLQTPLQSIFNNLFLLPTDTTVINFDPLFVLFFGLFVLIGITTVVSAWMLLSKPTLSLIHKHHQKMISKHLIKIKRLTKKSNFLFRFQVILSVSTSRKIMTLTSAFFLASVLLTVCLFVPGSLGQVGATYFKNFHANTMYNYNNVVGNSPFSRDEIYNWNGLGNPENLTNKFSKNIYPINTITPFANYIKIDNKLYNTQELLNSNEVPVETLKKAFDSVFAQLGWGFTGNQAKLFSSGLIGSLLKILSKTGRSEKSFDSLICTAISQILNVKTPKSASASSCMNDAIYNYPSIPIEVRQLFNSDPKIKSNFRIGWAALPFNKRTDELYTWYNSLLLNDDNSPILSNNTNLEIKTYGVLPNSKFVTFDKNQKHYMSKDWDQLSTENLNFGNTTSSYKVIPIIVNETLKKAENYHIGQYLNFYPEHKELQWKDNNNISHPMLTNVWSYPGEEESDGYSSLFNWQQLNQMINIPYRNLESNGIELYRNKTDEIYHPDQIKLNWEKQLAENGINKTSNDTQSDWWVNHFYNHNSYISSESNNYQYYTTHPFDPGFKYGYDEKSLKVNPLSPYTWSQTTSADLPSAMKLLKQTPHSSMWGTMEPDTNIPDSAGEMINEVLLNGTEQKSGKFSQSKLNKLIQSEQNYTPGTEQWNQQKCYLSLDERCINNLSLGYGSKVAYKIIGIHKSYNNPSIYLNQSIANKLLGFGTTKATVNSKLKDNFNNNYLWFNGKFTTESEPSDLTSMFIDTFNNKSMFLQSYSYHDVSILGKDSVALPGARHVLFSKFAQLTLPIIIIIIVTIMVVSVICIIMITNIFLSHFKRTIAIMKIQGYSRKTINWMMLGIFSPWVVLSSIIGFVLGWIIFENLGQKIFTAFGFDCGVSFINWVIPIAAVIIIGFYLAAFGTGIIVQNKLNALKIAESKD